MLHTPFHAFVKARELEGSNDLLAVYASSNIKVFPYQVAAAKLTPNKIIVAEMGFADDTAMANAHNILKDLGIKIKLV